ncbi:hypothetical protein DESC_290216 [Desulfosarcina cetonica]|nr:hypothetical protein DESC_290216 [Desulfosarcina cetonica]
MTDRFKKQRVVGNQKIDIVFAGTFNDVRQGIQSGPDLFHRPIPAADLKPHIVPGFSEPGRGYSIENANPLCDGSGHRGKFRSASFPSSKTKKARPLRTSPRHFPSPRDPPSKPPDDRGGDERRQGIVEWAHLGSNQGPTGYEPVALPAELWARLKSQNFFTYLYPLALSSN